MHYLHIHEDYQVRYWTEKWSVSENAARRCGEGGWGVRSRRSHENSKRKNEPWVLPARRGAAHSATCSGRIAVAIAQRWLDRIQVLPAYHTAVVLVSEMVISKMLKEKLYG
jgi:hypothetical protein